ncbi:MAG: EamA family transporter [Armatimonadetes bacterium]|nr:EamA family transporter [Armatimonadota bacterium]
MSLKLAVALLVMIASAALGDVTLKRGVDQIGPLEIRCLGDVWGAAVRFFGNGTVWAGIGLLAIYFFSFAVALSWADVSLVAPTSAVSFILTAWLASAHLGERVMPSRWIGTLLIVAGMALVVRNR